MLNSKIIIFIVSFILIGCTAQQPVNTTKKIAPCYRKAANEFMRWNKSNGKVLNGLTKRRQEEMELFLKGCND